PLTRKAACAPPATSPARSSACSTCRTSCPHKKRRLSGPRPDWQKRLPDVNRLLLEFDPELFKHVSGDRHGQTMNIVGCGATVVDQDKGLTIVHPGRPQSAPFPSSPINQPSCCPPICAIRLRVCNQTGLIIGDAPVTGSVNNRILEETAGVAQYRRVGQLASPNCTRGVEILLGGRLCTGVRQGLSECRVVQYRTPFSRQPQPEGQNEPASRF